MVKRIVFLIVLFYSTIAFAQHNHEFFTGDQFGIKWEESTLALGYYWLIERVDDKFVMAQGVTPELSISTSIQSAGSYIFYARAWNFTEDGETIQYSEWATSLTHGLVGGVVQPWQIKIKLKPVGLLEFFGGGDR